MHARRVELVPEIRTAGARAVLEVGPEHDVVGEQLGAPVEQIGERLLPRLGIERVLLLHTDPGKPTALLCHFRAKLRMLDLDLREFVAIRLPLVSCSDLVLEHQRLLHQRTINHQPYCPTTGSTLADGTLRANRSAVE